MNKKKLSIRIISLLLTCAVIFPLLLTAAFAKDNEEFIFADEFGENERASSYVFSFSKNIEQGSTGNTFVFTFPQGVHLDRKPSFIEDIESIELEDGVGETQTLTVVYKDAAFASSSGSVGFGMEINQASLLTDGMQHSYTIGVEYSAVDSDNKPLSKTDSRDYTIPNNVTATLKWDEAGSVSTIYQSYKETSVATDLYVDFDYDMTDFHTDDVLTVELQLTPNLEWRGSVGSYDAGTKKVTIPITKSMITESQNNDGKLDRCLVPASFCRDIAVQKGYERVCVSCPTYSTKATDLRGDLDVMHTIVNLLAYGSGGHGTRLAEETVCNAVYTVLVDKDMSDQPITRAEVITIVNRMLNRGVNAESTLLDFHKWPDNDDVNGWFYYDIIEATNEHKYTGSRPSEDWKSLTTDYYYDIVKYERP